MINIDIIRQMDAENKESVKVENSCDPKITTINKKYKVGDTKNINIEFSSSKEKEKWIAGFDEIDLSGDGVLDNEEICIYRDMECRYAKRLTYWNPIFWLGQLLYDNKDKKVIEAAEQRTEEYRSLDQ